MDPGFEGIGDFDSDDAWERYIAHQAAKGNYPAPRVPVTVITDEGVSSGVLTADEHGDVIEIVDAAKSWAAEVIADSSGKWNGNGLRFATQEEAEIYVADLARRWTLVTDTRVVPSPDEVTHKIVNGAMSRVGD